MNSYGNNAPGERYQDGDLVVRFPDCEQPSEAKDRCDLVAEPFIAHLHAAFDT